MSKLGLTNDPGFKFKKIQIYTITVKNSPKVFISIESSLQTTRWLSRKVILSCLKMTDFPDFAPLMISNEF